MDSEDWIIIAVVVAALAIFITMLAALVHSDTLNSRDARICMSHNMQWVDGNCVKLAR